MIIVPSTIPNFDEDWPLVVKLTKRCKGDDMDYPVGTVFLFARRQKNGMILAKDFRSFLWFEPASATILYEMKF